MLCFCICASVCEAVERASDLQQGLFGSCKQVDGWREFLEEVGSQISQSDALSPVHQQIQVGPDLHSSRPLVETTSRPLNHNHNNINSEDTIRASGNMLITLGYFYFWIIIKSHKLDLISTIVLSGFSRLLPSKQLCCTANDIYTWMQIFTPLWETRPKGVVRPLVVSNALSYLVSDLVCDSI